MAASLDQIAAEISGLKPKAYLLLGPGFVREDWKSLCFAKGKSVTQAAIQTLPQFAQTLLPESKNRLLDRSGRVELLRQSFKDPNLKSALPTLFAHQFRPKFYESLDRALQKGRTLFAHAAEAQALEERLLERLGFDPRREEFFLLNRFWESLLRSRMFFDESRILELAEVRLQSGFQDAGELLPVKKIYRANHFLDSPRTEFFWQSLSKRVEIELVRSDDFRKNAGAYPVQRRISHSLEDALQSMFDEILKADDLNHHAVVIEDRPEIRRSITRVARERGLALLDVRDPTRVLTSEAIKSVLLPLEMVARNFPSELVLPDLSSYVENAGEFRRKIIEFGEVTGIENYQNLPAVFMRLNQLKLQFPARISVSALEEGVFKVIRDGKFPSWIQQTFEKVFNAWKMSWESLNLLESVRPLRVMADELKEKLKTVPPVVGPERNEVGLRLYRVDQAVALDLISQPETRVHFFGVSSSFFEPRENSSEWFSVRDIEVLSSEFGLPGKKHLADQIKSSFLSWASQASSAAILWESIYDENGSETESIELVLKSMAEIRLLSEQKIPVHEKLLPSFASHLKVSAHFTKAPLRRTEFPLSFLNALGNCAFTAYAQHLLKLYDERDPDFDLSGDSFGNLVHSAVETLVASKLQISPEDAFAEAWKKTAKPAWIRSERLLTSIRGKTISILESFLESEKNYREQSRAELIDQEVPIELKRGGLTFNGRIDRIDQHTDGIVLFDYKTSSVLPSGSVTRSNGKGLQLPAYALAIKDRHAQEVVSAQYIQLLPRKTGRNSGFLFSQWNKGKKADLVEFPLSSARGGSGSLMVDPPESVWQELDQKIGSLIDQAKAGNFEAHPADPKDCQRCRYRILCGKSRLPGDVVEGEDT